MLTVNPFAPLPAGMDGFGGIAGVRAIFMELDERPQRVALRRRILERFGRAPSQLARTKSA